MMSDPTPRQLDYAPPQPAGAYRRRGGQILKWATIIAALIASIYYGPSTVQQIFYVRAQQRCLNFNLPENQVVYTNDSTDASVLNAAGYKPVATLVGRALNATGQGNTPRASAGFLFPPLAEVGEDTIASYGQSGTGYVRLAVPGAPIRTGGFLHARRNPQVGEDRLVAIVFVERQDPPVYPPRPQPWWLDVNALVWRRATWQPGTRLQLLGLTTTALGPIDDHDVKVFAGQPDPADPAHFTLPFSIDNQKGVIDGNLDFLDRVQLKVRDPSPAQSSGRATTRLSKPIGVDE